MPSNGYRRREAVAPKLQSLGEVINRTGQGRASEGMPTVALANRSKATIKRGQTAIPSIATLVNRSGGK